MPSKRNRKSRPNTEIRESQGFVIGDFATVVNNFWDEKILKRLGLEQRVSFIILFLSIVAVGIGLYFSLRTSQPGQPAPPETMDGNFRIAVASFQEIGNSQEVISGYELAESVRKRLERDLGKINTELDIRIWGPDRIGSITGDDRIQRSDHASEIAAKINADMVIYGVVDYAKNQWQVLPEFYITAKNFHEASEITGQSDLGDPISLTSSDTPTWRVEFDKQMLARSKALSIISLGLGYISLGRYDKAVETFQSGRDIEDWDDDQGKKVWYLMTSYAAGKLGESNMQSNMREEAEKSFALAEDQSKQALSIDPEYARPYIGLANVSYMRAILLWSITEKPSDIDVGQLEECYRFLEKAELAEHKPDEADVETKIHFARGQCLLMEVYSGKGNSTNFSPAIKEFEQVIASYNNGKNPHVEDLASESYARLGLIYDLTNNLPQSVENYQKAAELLKAVPTRQQHYQDRAIEIQQTLTPSSP